MKIIVAVLSYNLPSLTDRLVAQLKNLISTDVEFVVFDNGSDKEKVAESTTHSTSANSRFTGGANHIFKIAKEKHADYVWLCTNDIRVITSADPVASMVSKCQDYSLTGIIHPSLVRPIPQYAYDWMVKVPGAEELEGVTTNHPMVDFIAPFFTRTALDAMEWQIDPAFAYFWGGDYDACLAVRKAGMEVSVDFDTLISHATSATYEAGEDAEFKGKHDYYAKAMVSMNEVMWKKHGKDWRSLFKRLDGK